MNLNQYLAVGNLTADPEVRFTPKGTPVASASVAVNESYTADGERKTITTFVDLQVWGPAAEALGKLAKKGQELLVSGALRMDKWEDKETGKTRSRLFVKVDNWQFTQYLPKNSEAQPPAEEPKAKAKKDRKAEGKRDASAKDPDLDSAPADIPF
jgi:single-strand DNA-binding protein